MEFKGITYELVFYLSQDGYAVYKERIFNDRDMAEFAEQALQELKSLKENCFWLEEELSQCKSICD